MGLPADYHMHTPLCRHAVGTPIEYAAQAARVGLEEIGFSDHSPMPQSDFDDWRMRFEQLDDYVAQVEQARRTQPGLRIKLALEVDYLPGYEAWIRDLAARHPWDYLIGSVHYISEDWDIDNPKKLAKWHEHDPLAVWTAYLERLTRAADSGLFDILGHLDLCKKFAFYPQQDCAHLFRRLLEMAARRGVAIEINTAGLRKDCRELYPSSRWLALAQELGVGLTFGSDAHAPEEVGADFTAALDAARHAGYTHACRFTRRQPEHVRL
ncbi:MAG: histidinol-phosphatase HisJ family protein [Verrucomicrobia bacterium]|nr:histidinol-phosphatase HisJ family protein [Verrucomicrobiota bacterium]